MEKILFINHSASKTGAPILLLQFLKWLKYERHIKFDVLSLQNGDLLDEFTAVSDTHFYKKASKNIFNKVNNYIKNKQESSTESNLFYTKHALKKIAKREYNLIYANSVISVPAAFYIKNQAKNLPKLLVHFHELNMIIHQFCSNLNAYQSAIDSSITASNKVKHNLVENWNWDASLIQTVYAHSKLSEVKVKTDSTFIVGASGIANWRKGPDYFLLVAAYVFKKIPEAVMKFQWVGRVSGLNRLILEEDIKRLGLVGKVEFTGEKDNPHDYFTEFDMLLMTSKEDPFPLVCIEVGMLKKPIVCFEGATGTEEVLTNVEGAIVPYLDIEKMGDMVIKNYLEPYFKQQTGAQVKQIFDAFTPERQGEKLYDVMLGLLNTSKY